MQVELVNKHHNDHRRTKLIFTITISEAVRTHCNWWIQIRIDIRIASKTIMLQVWVRLLRSKINQINTWLKIKIHCKVKTEKDMEIESILLRLITRDKHKSWTLVIRVIRHRNCLIWELRRWYLERQLVDNLQRICKEINSMDKWVDNRTFKS